MLITKISSSSTLHTIPLPPSADMHSSNIREGLSRMWSYVASCRSRWAGIRCLVYIYHQPTLALSGRMLPLWQMAASRPCAHPQAVGALCQHCPDNTVKKGSSSFSCSMKPKGNLFFYTRGVELVFVFVLIRAGSAANVTLSGQSLYSIKSIAR